MQLLPINTPEILNMVAVWLADRSNYQWLDFGNGVQNPSATTLRIMDQKNIHELRVFTADDDRTPIGIAGLSNVDRYFKTASIWIVLGDKHYGGKGHALRAASKMLTLAFDNIGLNSVLAWAVECNHASMRVIRRLNFSPIGRQRQCHYLDGRIYDRLWFDLLSSEHKVPRLD